MDIKLKQRIAERIIQSDDDFLLNEIKSLVGLSDNDFWNDLPAQVKSAINEAKDQLDRGDGIPHDDVMTEMKSRFIGR
ncbi:MAG: hypothetical protein M3O71_07445 [Bacteroidota bacterium]|nr:hypothetical protein [Bacteroidota bacterium]